MERSAQRSTTKNCNFLGVDARFATIKYEKASWIRQAFIIFVFLNLVSFATASLTVPIEMIAPVLSEKAEPKYSHDESRLAYLAQDDRGAYNLYVDGRRLTNTRRAISKFFWEEDDQHLLYLYDEKGTEDYHLFRVDLNGESVDLTPYSNVHVEFIALSPRAPDRVLVRMNLRDPRYLDCYYIDLVSQQVSPASLFVNHRDKVFANDKLIPSACINFHPTGKKFLEVYEKNAWRFVCALDPNDWYPAIISENEKEVILLTSTNLPARGLLTIDKKTGEQKVLFSHQKLDVLEGYFDPISGNLQAATVRDGRLEWHFLDDGFQREIKGIEEKLGDGEVFLLSRLSQDNKWFIKHQKDDAPVAYYVLDRETGSLELVLQESPELLKYSFGKMETIHFLASDGQKIQGYFLRPPQKEPPYPTILQIHGGPHLRDCWEFQPQSQYFASQGYATLFINYRGSSGFGTRFMMADSGQWSKRVFQDLIDGKRWAEQQGLVDPKKVAINGESFGGYLALLGLSSGEFACGIANVPITEPANWMPNEYISWGYTYSKLFRDASVGAISPVNCLDKMQAPLLMVHGENDYRVRLRQSQKMAEELRSCQKPFTYHILPGDGHVYLDPDNRRFFFQELEAFLEKYLKD